MSSVAPEWERWTDGILRLNANGYTFKEVLLVMIASIQVARLEMKKFSIQHTSRKQVQKKYLVEFKIEQRMWIL